MVHITDLNLLLALEYSLVSVMPYYLRRPGEKRRRIPDSKMGHMTQRGPRGGVYYVSSGGRKVYVTGYMVAQAEHGNRRAQRALGGSRVKPRRKMW